LGITYKAERNQGIASERLTSKKERATADLALPLRSRQASFSDTEKWKKGESIAPAKSGAFFAPASSKKCHPDADIPTGDC